MVLIKDSEAGAGEFCRISVGKKLLVNTQEARLGQLAIGTILSESFVPLFDLLLGNLSRYCGPPILWVSFWSGCSLSISCRLSSRLRSSRFLGREI